MKTLSQILLVASSLLGGVSHLHAQNDGITYQGRVTSNGTNFTGSGQFKFALVTTNSSDTTHWSNGGTSAAGSEPADAVTISVVGGLFTARLGDASLVNMTAFGAGLFLQPDLQLRIWFNDGVNGFAALNPAQPLTAAPYALVATAASNLLGVLPVSQLSGPISSAQFAGTYGNAIAFTNGGNTLSGNARA